MHHNVYTFFSVHNCLDEEFDAPDIAADHDLCQAIVAGRMGLHPEAWSSQSALTAVMPLGFYGYEETPPAHKPYERVYHPSPADLKAARHWPRPVEEPPPRRKPGPKPRPQWHWVPPADRYPPEPPVTGNVQLTCDDCNARYRLTMYYRGNRPHVVQSIRLMGKTEGWTCILGRDRCPGCSHIPPPEDVGHGAGQRQGDEQHG